MDNFDLVKKLLDLPWYNLILISLLVIPIFITVWITLFSSIGIILNNKQKVAFVAAFVMLYTVGLAIGKVGQASVKKQFYEKYGNAVENKIRTGFSRFKVITYNQIKLSYPELTTENIEALVETYPDRFEVTGIGDPNNLSKALSEDPKGIHLLK